MALNTGQFKNNIVSFHSIQVAQRQALGGGSTVAAELGSGKDAGGPVQKQGSFIPSILLRSFDNLVLVRPADLCSTGFKSLHVSSNPNALLHLQ